MTAPFAPRQLTVHLVVDRETITKARLERRTFDVSRALKGRPLGDVPAIAAALLPVCGAAHRAAARGAVEQALGQPLADARSRAIAVLAERIANGVWRLGLDLAAALSIPQRAACVVAARDAARQLAAIPDKDASSLLEQALTELLDLRQLTDAALSRFPSADLARLADRAFDDPREALAALRAILAGSLDPTVHAGAGGEVTTSRGLLRHQCSAVGDRVLDYAIEAPTDRIAAPDGPLARALVGLPHGGDPRAAAQLVCALHDPCEAVAIHIDTVREDAHA